MLRNIVCPTILAVAVLLLTPGVSAAQAKLTGVVRDSSGSPVSGAEVWVESVARRATTGRRGDYEVTGIPAGTVTISVRRLGFAPFSGSIVVTDGANRLDVVLTPVARELDTVTTRQQQLWRESPLLREMEENRRIGLGQFVTREDLAKMQGGFISQVFNSMRGIVVVHGSLVASHTWLANKYIPNAGDRVELEDRSSGEGLNPVNADLNYCFPDIYLDYTRISGGKRAANISQFSPDQLQGIQVFLGAAETPMRYASGASSCGVIVFHTRVPEVKPRRIASTFEGPTRSRFSGSVSVSTAKSGAACADCGIGTAMDAMVGYAFRDRIVVNARYAKWSAFDGGAQDITLQMAVLEWYQDPDPGRYKLFANVAAGRMSVALKTSHDGDFDNYTDEFTGKGIPAIGVGTGIDISLVRRFVVTPFLSHTRSVGGTTGWERCVNKIVATNTVVTTCNIVPEAPRTYNLTQFGTRLGWR